MGAGEKPAAECCVCGRELPNRYAVAGRCEAADCRRPFCDLHWRRGNRRCPEHGYVEQAADPPPRQEAPARTAEPPPKGAEAMNETPKPQPAARKIDLARIRQAMKDAFAAVGRMRVGAQELLRRLRKDRTPEEMLKTIDEATSANEQRREKVSARAETLFTEIAAKRKAFAQAPPARKRTLELELRSKIATHEAAERELAVLLENERVLAQTRGRLMEVSAYGMAGVTEIDIDRVIDEIEEAAEEAEGRVGAADDLEKAGRRRERESAHDDFMEKLAGYEAPADAAETTAPEPEPETKAPAPEEKPRAKQRETGSES